MSNLDTIAGDSLIDLMKRFILTKDETKADVPEIKSDSDKIWKEAYDVMDDIVLTDEIISKIKKDAFDLTRKLMGSNLKAVILYGSCARGDYTKDSDVDIVLLTGCDRMEVKQYDDGLDSIATQLAMKYFAVVNFVCLPQDEFLEKKAWYGYFQNIDREGELVYG